MFGMPLNLLECSECFLGWPKATARAPRARAKTPSLCTLFWRVSFPLRSFSKANLFVFDCLTVRFSHVVFPFMPVITNKFSFQRGPGLHTRARLRFAPFFGAHAAHDSLFPEDLFQTKSFHV